MLRLKIIATQRVDEWKIFVVGMSKIRKCCKNSAGLEMK